MENHDLWIEVTKLAIWPIFWLIVVGIAGYLIGPYIRSQFSSLTKFSYGSINFEFEKPLAVQNEMQKKQGQTLPFYDSYASPVVNQDKKLILDDLNSRRLSYEDQKQLLIHELANQRVYNHYWWITHNIYIEQIHLLRHLNSALPLTKEGMGEFYDQYAAKQSGDALSTSEQFFAWLTSNQLILEDLNACYCITHKGRDYLKFLINIGIK